jgi:hypothetical protein
MYFPWCGLLNQIKLADIFVHYNDVQLSRGFYNRVQVMGPQGITYITVPLRNRQQKQLINESYISYEKNWIADHRSILIRAFRNAKYLDDAISIFDHVHKTKFDLLSNLCQKSIMSLCAYFSVEQDTQFLQSDQLIVSGKSSQRLFNIVSAVGGNIYLTGHGALNYLDHELFDRNDIEVQYMKYRITEYPQFSAQFTPYLTALDAVAHLGADAHQVLQSTNVNWKDALAKPHELRA